MRFFDSKNSARRLLIRRGFLLKRSVLRRLINLRAVDDNAPFHPGVVHPHDTKHPETYRKPEEIRKTRKRRLEIPLPPVKLKYHTDALDVTANIYSWGNGSHGALGQGHYRDVPYPTQVLALQRIPIKHVASGWSHAVCVTEDGHIYRWGWIDDVKTTFTNANMKKRVPRFTNAWQKTGQLFSPQMTNWFFRDASDLTPKIVEGLQGIPISKAICGCGFTVALSADGRVYSWGHGRWGNLGHRIFVSWSEIFAVPKLITRLRDIKIVDIACGYVHTLFLDENGGLWACGPGVNGRLGLGEGAARGEYPLPIQVSPLWEQRMYQVNRKIERRMRSRGRNVKIEDYIPFVTKIACGHKHSAVITDDGKLWTFGAGIFGALGHGHDFRDQWWPAQVAALKDEIVIDVKCGQHHSVALTATGEVWTWGMSRHGQCARPRGEAFMLSKFDELGEDMSIVKESPPPDRDVDLIVENDPLAMKPGKIKLPEGVVPFAIEAGWYNTSVIDQEGRLWTWGEENGRLTYDPEPKLYEVAPGIRQVDHGWLHSLAVTRRSDEETWMSWHERPETPTKPERPPTEARQTLLLASDSEDEDDEDITLFEAFRRAREARLEGWERDSNMIIERTPEKDEAAFQKTIEHREKLFQENLKQKRLAAEEEQKKLESETKEETPESQDETPESQDEGPESQDEPLKKENDENIENEAESSEGQKKE